MKATGDIEAINLRTGEQQRRVTGDGESRLELVNMTDAELHDYVLYGFPPDALRDAFQAWREWAENREKETTWRRDLSGTPGNIAEDQFMFMEGFKKGRQYALSQRPPG